jgi:hypothetical protein
MSKLNRFVLATPRILVCYLVFELSLVQLIVVVSYEVKENSFNECNLIFKFLFLKFSSVWLQLVKHE